MGGCVLVVDDEATVRMMLSYLLSQESVKVYLASDAPTALALLQSEPIDLVLTDYHMPGMTGLELARAIRATHATLPIALMSGLASLVAKIDLEAAGIDKVFIKPFDIFELLDWIQSVLLDIESDE